MIVKPQNQPFQIKLSVKSNCQVRKPSYQALKSPLHQSLPLYTMLNKVCTKKKMMQVLLFIKLISLHVTRLTSCSPGVPDTHHHSRGLCSTFGRSFYDCTQKGTTSPPGNWGRKWYLMRTKQAVVGDFELD